MVTLSLTALKKRLMMTVIDNVVFIEYVKASDPELNNDMYICSTEPCILSLTDIDSQNKLSEMALSQKRISYGFFQ